MAKPSTQAPGTLSPPAALPSYHSTHHHPLLHTCTTTCSLTPAATSLPTRTQIVIRRLEVETELRRRQLRRVPRAWQPPALDISMAKRDMSHLEGTKMPQEFLCPMSMQLMTDPVVTPTGVTYDRCAAGMGAAMH